MNTYGLSSAVEPEQLEHPFVERVNAGDLDGLVALYEPNAVVSTLPGKVATGSDAIRRALGDFRASGAKLTIGDQQPTLRTGDLALTSTRVSRAELTAEIARRQPDGTWRWTGPGTPALLTSSSIGPSRRRSCAIAASAARGSLTSAVTDAATPPAASMSSTDSANSSPERATSPTATPLPAETLGDEPPQASSPWAFPGSAQGASVHSFVGTSAGTTASTTSDLKFELRDVA